jgi:hypothetical protein
MPDTPWDRHRFDAFLKAPQDLEGLVAAIDALPPADREAASTALDRELPALRHRLKQEGHRDHATDVGPWHRGIVLVTLLDSTPSQVASMVTAWWVWKLWENEEVFGRVREALLARDRDWTQQLVDAILDRPDVGIHTRLAHPLVVTHNLPLPTQPEYWQLWAHELAIPRSEQRWEEHFLAACAVPDVLAGTSNGQADYARHVARSAEILRKLEPTNDPALARALLQVFARGDRSGAQRMALLWLEALNLEEQIQEARAPLLAALPNADNTVVKFAIKQFLARNLAPDELTELALIVLNRRERASKRTLLRALTSLDSPPTELLEVVGSLATQPDATTARLAASLLEHWNATDTTQPVVEERGAHHD